MDNPVSISNKFTELVGDWLGVNHLWLTPDSPEIVSEAEAEVELAAQEKFLQIRYTWVYADVIQEGLLLIGADAENSKVSAAWLDAWHYTDQMMHCRGEVLEDGSMKVTGTYPAPEGPDWGWWITVKSEDFNHFSIVMHNVTPDGLSYQAVLMTFERLN